MTPRPSRGTLRVVLLIIAAAALSAAATEAFAQSSRRTRGYDAATWERIGRESHGITRRFGALLRAGAPPDGAEAVALAEEHREHISRWFYDCSPEMHRGLGELYAADARFAGHWDAVEPGLTEFVRRAFAAPHA